MLSKRQLQRSLNQQVNIGSIINRFCNGTVQYSQWNRSLLRSFLFQDDKQTLKMKAQKDEALLVICLVSVCVCMCVCVCVCVCVYMKMNKWIKNKSMSTDQLTYIGVALGVAVLVLALVLLIFCRIKRRRAAFASGMTETDPPPGFLHSESTETITIKPFTTQLYIYTGSCCFFLCRQKPKHP